MGFVTAWAGSPAGAGSCVMVGWVGGYWEPMEMHGPCGRWVSSLLAYSVVRAGLVSSC